MEDMKKSAPRIERKSSIESEPRTLLFDQIEYAREAAQYVMNTNTIEEALKIFTEGLQPVVTARAEAAAAMAVESDEDQWNCHVGYLRHPLTGGLGDVLTAPF